MDSTYVTYSSLGATIIAIILGIINLIRLKKIEKTRSNLLTTPHENLDQILDLILKKNQELTRELNNTNNHLGEIEKLSLKSLQKVGTTKFNSISTDGGNFSFAIALLDYEHNGLVISNLHARDTNRIYLKPIKNGNSHIPLTPEEKEALEKAFIDKYLDN